EPEAAAQELPAESAGRPVALITGGTSSLGMAVAGELARRGWSIFFQHSASPTEAHAAETAIGRAADAAGADIQIASLQADLAVSADREQLVEGVLETFGRVDMLVNVAAGTANCGQDLLELSETAYQSVMDSVLASTLFLTQRVASEMVRLVEAGMIESPKIVTVNSIYAYTTSVDEAATSIAQSALAMLTRLFADRLGEYGIGVYEVRAGILAAGPADSAYAKYDSLIAQGLTPIRRWGRPGDVARAIAAIAEDLLGFSTGQVIDVDGGFHLRRL
ncbi:MAG: SDR family oxidoreductase, partial [Planctomycetaceae bacterium]